MNGREQQTSDFAGARHVTSSTGVLRVEAPWRILETTESQIVDLTRELLGIEQMEPTDNFFDLGGDSLLAVTLLSRVEALLGVWVPLASFLGAPTPEGLALSLRQEAQQPSGSSLVRICGRGDQRPFFCAHPGGGEVYRMSNLKRTLGDRPVYGLFSVGFNGETEPLVSIEAMAARYLTEIIRVQPSGPYLLGGYSVGGVVAYELAHQLLRRGEQVGYVALFEPMLRILRPPPGDGAQDQQPSLSVDEILTLDGLSSRGSELPSIRALRQSLGRRRARSLEELEALLTMMKPLLAGALDELKAAGHIIPDMDILDFYRLREIWAKYVWAALSYRVVPLPGTLTVFVGQGSVAESILEQPVGPGAAKPRMRRFTESHGMLFTDPEVARQLAVDLEAAEQPSPAAQPPARPRHPFPDQGKGA